KDIGIARAVEPLPDVPQEIVDALVSANAAWQRADGKHAAPVVVAGVAAPRVVQPSIGVAEASLRRARKHPLMRLVVGQALERDWADLLSVLDLPTEVFACPRAVRESIAPVDADGGAVRVIAGVRSFALEVCVPGTDLRLHLGVRLRLEKGI